MHNMNYMDALNKNLALVLWAKDKNGDDDVAVFPGVLIKEGNSYFLKRKSEETKPEIKEEWLSRIKIVPAELKETLQGCEYQLSLTVGSTEDVTESLESFGLNWPND